MIRINDYLTENCSTTLRDSIMNDNRIVGEGIKDLLNTIKDKFSKVVQYFKGLCARISKSFPVWLSVNDNGETIPVSLPLTASQAYVDGYINKESTVVVGDNQTKSITGNSAKPGDAKKLYGSGNSLQYWKKFNEDLEENDLVNVICEYLDTTKEELINEVKMHTDDPNAKYNVVTNDGLRDEIDYILSEEKPVPLLILGAPGIGKTAILDQVIKSLPDANEWSMIVKTLSNETPDNFFLPKYTDVDGQTKAEDVPKLWLPMYKPTGDPAEDSRRDKECGKGLLFVDELSRATAQVLNVCLPLINERRMNGWVLGSGWKIICASNRPEDDETGQAILGNAMRNRYSIVYFEPTADEWAEWAKKQKYISPLLTQWLTMPETNGGNKFFYWDPNEAGDQEHEGAVMCTPRSWDNAMRRLCTFAKTGDLEGFKIFDVPRQKIMRALGGCIPSQAIDSFLAFLDTVSKIGNFDEAVKSVWQKAGAGLKISDKNLRVVSLPLAQLIITAHAQSLPTEKEFNNVCKWLVNTDSDQLASYVIDIFKNVFGENLKDDLKDFIFCAKYQYDEQEDLVKNAPAEFKKAKTASEQSKWFEKVTKGLSKNSADYKKYSDINAAGSMMIMLNNKMRPFLDRWKFKDLSEMPDYSGSILELGKRFKDGPMIELASGTKSLF